MMVGKLLHSSNVERGQTFWEWDNYKGLTINKCEEQKMHRMMGNNNSFRNGHDLKCNVYDLVVRVIPSPKLIS